MSVITISRGTHSRGSEIAVKVAQKLGYSCVSREILLSASTEFDIPEFTLTKAIQSVPSLFDRLAKKPERYIALIQAALLRHLQKDDVVYHGLAGHFFVREIPHVLKVRIITDLDERIKLVMERDGINHDQASVFLKKIDRQRQKWGLHLYGIDTSDSHLYDLVINLKTMGVEDAVDLICHVVGRPTFQTTDESRRAMTDLVLTSEFRVLLMDMSLDLEFSVADGVVTLKPRTAGVLTEELMWQLDQKLWKIAGFKGLRAMDQTSTNHTNPFHNI